MEMNTDGLLSHGEPGPLSQVRGQWFCPYTCTVVLEYWSFGVLEKTKSEDSILDSFCITALLHYSK